MINKKFSVTLFFYTFSFFQKNMLIITRLWELASITTTFLNNFNNLTFPVKYFKYLENLIITIA